MSINEVVVSTYRELIILFYLATFPTLKLWTN